MRGFAQSWLRRPVGRQPTSEPDAQPGEDCSRPECSALPSARSAAPRESCRRFDRAQGAFVSYQQLPLTFVPNDGRVDADVRYTAQAGGASFFFTPTEVVTSLTKG